LPNTPWLTADWDAFIAWLSNLNIAQQIVLPNDPTAVPIDIVAEIYIKGTTSSLVSLQNLITANLRAAFVLRSGVLGYSRYLSDIGTVIEESDASVDYYDITTPSTDTVISIYQYVTLNSVTLNMHYSQRGVLS
jgi:hypothetical protein